MNIKEYKYRIINKIIGDWAKSPINSYKIKIKK